MSKVTVVIDAQALSSVASGSGVGTYLRGLMGELAVRPDIELVAMCKPGVERTEGIEVMPVRRISRRARPEAIENAFRLPVELWRHRGAGSVFHNPGVHAPLGVGKPWVQTLHDVIPLVLDSYEDAALQARWKRFGPRYKNASAVIAISRHAADEGIRLLGLDPAKVHVALHGFDPVFSVGDGVGAEGSDEGPYLLVVSEYSRRKGFAEAFAVIDALVEAGYPHRLVVAGQVHDWGRQELADLHAAARHPERIELRGFVDDLVALYRGASVFLWTSRYEGFGLPPLEAMASGVPVVAFSNSSATEVVGGGGLLVSDGDVVAMTAAVRRLLDSPALWEEQRARGLENVHAFSWARSAAVHAEVYRSVSEIAA